MKTYKLFIIYFGIAGMFGLSLNMLYFIIKAYLSGTGRVNVYYDKFGEMNIEIVAISIVVVCGLYGLIKTFSIINNEIKCKKERLFTENTRQ